MEASVPDSINLVEGQHGQGKIKPVVQLQDRLLVLGFLKFVDFAVEAAKVELMIRINSK